MAIQEAGQRPDYSCGRCGARPGVPREIWSPVAGGAAGWGPFPLMVFARANGGNRR
jgi:hypothetical protein